MPQLPIRRWCKDLGERGLPGSRNIATAWGNKLTHIVCISSISSSSTPANWSSRIFIWNREERLEKRDGGSKSLPYSPPYHWLQQSVGKSLKQAAFPVFRHAHQTSKLSKGSANDHSPLHPGSAAAFSEPLFTLLTRDQDVYMRTVGVPQVSLWQSVSKKVKWQKNMKISMVSSSAWRQPCAEDAASGDPEEKS